jgi:uncharacterized protein (TIGR02246 family)
MRKAIVTAFAVALALAVTPALAQQKSAPTDRAMEAATAMAKKVTDAINKKDAAGYAALYTSDGVFVGPDGKAVKGAAAITALQAATFKAWGDFKFSATTQEARATGNRVWAIVDATIDGKGPNGPISLRSHVLNVYVPEGKGWKIAVTSVGLNVTPPGMPPAR